MSSESELLWNIWSDEIIGQNWQTTITWSNASRFRCYLPKTSFLRKPILVTIFQWAWTGQMVSAKYLIRIGHLSQFQILNSFQPSKKHRNNWFYRCIWTFGRQCIYSPKVRIAPLHINLSAIRFCSFSNQLLQLTQTPESLAWLSAHKDHALAFFDGFSICFIDSET